jgi:hypothetical protein
MMIRQRLPIRFYFSISIMKDILLIVLDLF